MSVVGLLECRKIDVWNGTGMHIETCNVYYYTETIEWDDAVSTQ